MNIWVIATSWRLLDLVDITDVVRKKFLNLGEDASVLNAWTNYSISVDEHNKRWIFMTFLSYTEFY